MTRIPSFRNSWMAFGLSSFMVSATAMIPSILPSCANNSGVFPCSASSCACVRSSFETPVCSLRNLRLPPRSNFPLLTAWSPFPGSASNSVTSSGFTESSSPRRIIAFASGCSLFASRETARESSSSSVIFPAGITSVTFGSPSVIVPVLSSATISIFPAFSRIAAVLNKIPFFAPTPFPTIIATGVASPSAHGQLITSTEIPLASAKLNSFPIKSHTIKVTTAMEMTTGTNTPDTLSAILAIGALVAAASLTILIIWESVVSTPTLVASQRINPDWFIVAADTSSPTVLSTGMLSPVRAASALLPSKITPSTGIFSPGRTTKISPWCTCPIGTVTSCPPRTIVAFCGASFIRLFKASVVLPLDLASSVLPTVIKVRIIAADSK